MKFLSKDRSESADQPPRREADRERNRSEQEMPMLWVLSWPHSLIPRTHSTPYRSKSELVVGGAFLKAVIVQGEFRTSCSLETVRAGSNPRYRVPSQANLPRRVQPDAASESFRFHSGGHRPSNICHNPQHTRSGCRGLRGIFVFGTLFLAYSVAILISSRSYRIE